MDISRKILSDITHHMKYAKFRPSDFRRETFEETVDRNVAMHIKKYPHLEQEIREAYKFVYERKVLPSMRSMQFAGRAIEVCPSRQYNCSYLAVDDVRSFSEIMFLLLGGTGVGFSVQSHHVEQLPEIRKPNKKRTRRFLIGDSIEGWADAVKALMKSYFDGSSKINFDFTDIRPKGALLVTAGGKAPGPQPLKECLMKLEGILETKQDGDKLTPIEVHDIVCHIADAVLAGGIRRSALISLFDADDLEIISAKTGNWWETNPQRGRANNSAVVLRHKVTKDFFMQLWDRVKQSGSGEPGIYLTNDRDVGTNPCKPLRSTILTKEGYITFAQALEKDSLEVMGIDGEWKKATKPFKTGENRVVSRFLLSNGKYLYGTPNHRHLDSNGIWREMKDMNESDFLRSQDRENPLQIVEIVRDFSIEDVYDITVDDESHAFYDADVVTHNCAEISLRNCGFCNLTEVNVSDLESQEDYEQRVRSAAFIGTLQASYTDFHYLRDVWKKNAEKEALLGVSMTGIASNLIFNMDIEKAAKVAVEENKRAAKLLGINPARRVTTTKPSGTSSLILGTSSGIHAWHSEYYIRRIRVGKNEAIYSYLKTNHPELVEDEYFRPHDTAVISVPQKAPEGSLLRSESPINFLERVKTVHNKWIKPGHIKGENTHNVSATISIKENEWDEVGEWMWNNRDSYTGLSVLPYSEHTYVQAPFEEFSKEEYERLFQSLQNVDLSQIFETEDETDLQGEVACQAGNCEIK